MPSYPIGYYVYRLLDPRTDLPFYVGKGQRRRAWVHEAAVRSGDLSGNARKVAKISEILARGDAVSVEIVAIYDLESDALDHEFRLVDESPTLTNVAPGGCGGSLSRKATERRAEARRLLLERARKRERRQAFENERARQYGKHLSAARSPAESAQITAWLDGLKGRAADKILTPRISALSEREARERAAAEKSGRSRRLRGRKSRLRQGMIEELDKLF